MDLAIVFKTTTKKTPLCLYELCHFYLLCVRSMPVFEASVKTLNEIIKFHLVKMNFQINRGISCSIENSQKGERRKQGEWNRNAQNFRYMDYLCCNGKRTINWTTKLADSLSNIIFKQFFQIFFLVLRNVKFYCVGHKSPWCSEIHLNVFKCTLRWI